MRFISDKIVFTSAMKTFVEETTLKKLRRLDVNISDIDVKLNRLNNENVKVEMSIEKFRVQVVDKNFYKAVREAADKLKTIINKSTDKNNKKIKNKVHKIETADDEFNVTALISKQKTFSLKPITVEEAVSELEHRDYTFYVFRNTNEEGCISVLYKRHDDDYGIIKCL